MDIRCEEIKTTTQPPVINVTTTLPLNVTTIDQICGEFHVRYGNYIPKYASRQRQSLDQQEKTCNLSCVDPKTFTFQSCKDQQYNDMIEIEDCTRFSEISWQPTRTVIKHPCTQKYVERRGDISICFNCKKLLYKGIIWSRKILGECYDDIPLVIDDKALFQCV